MAATATLSGSAAAGALAGGSDGSSSGHTHARVVLEKETEWRCEVNAAADGSAGIGGAVDDATSGYAFVKLVSGNAELFGVELAEGVTYQFAPGRKIAIFSWYAAELLVWGNIGYNYKSSDTSMPMYASLHARLEARREEAKAGAPAHTPVGSASGTGAGEAGNGPRVMVVGPVDAGKSTLCRILCAYSCRVGRAPTFVDLDIGQGDISIPGAIAATPLDKLCLSVEEGYTQIVPLTYFFGYATPSENMDVYRNCVQRLADTVNRRLANDDVARASGLIVNTMGWIDGGGYDLLLHAIKAFEADVIVVMGSDLVWSRLAEDLKGMKFPFRKPASDAAAAGAAPDAATGGPMKTVSVVKIARSEGVRERSREARKEARRARIREYFYGPERAPGLPPALSPAPLTVGFDDVMIVRVGGATIDSTLLPIGQASALDPLRTSVVSIGPSLANHVLGVSYATTEKQIPHSNVAGFVHVTAVNMETRLLSLLVPCAGPLPSKYLIQGDIKWME